MRRSALHIGIGILAVVGAAACESPTKSHVVGCSVPVRATASPGDTAIVVGSVFQARVSMVGCSGESVTEVARFVAADTAVLSVNADDGVIGGRAVGESDVLVFGERYGLLTRFHIIVQPPPR